MKRQSSNFSESISLYRRPRNNLCLSQLAVCALYNALLTILWKPLKWEANIFLVPPLAVLPSGKERRYCVPPLLFLSSSSFEQTLYNYNNNNNRIERRNSRFSQSPHCAANWLQHVRSFDPGAIVCKPRATHRARITCNIPCAIWHGATAQLLS